MSNEISAKTSFIGLGNSRPETKDNLKDQSAEPSPTVTSAESEAVKTTQTPQQKDSAPKEPEKETLLRRLMNIFEQIQSRFRGGRDDWSRS